MEESFPRGGVDKVEAKKSRKEKDLFFQDGKSKVQKKGGKDKKGGKEKKGGKDKKKDGKGVVAEGKKKHKMEGEVSGQIKSQQPQFLSHKTIYPGMLMLGYVKQIKSYSLNIALPNGLLGSVPITKISHAYTESLQKFSEAEGENVENVSTLLELFKVGMVVPCKLTDADVEAGSKGLSIDPKDVNSDLTATNLRHGMIVYGNVSSCEDHGYIIDLGVKGVQAFLKKKQASRYVQLYNEGGPLSVGQCVMCKINMKGDRMAVLAGDNRVINVTIDPLDLKNIETVEGSDIPFTSLIPGMKVHAKVDRVVRDDGIVVEFYKFKGLIHNSHLPKPPSSYNHSDQVTCSILYIHPLTKTVTLTMLPHLTEYVGVPSGLFDKVKVGQIFEEAKVKKTEKHRGVLLDLQNGLTAIAAKNNLSDNDVENIQKIFKKGSTHRCRVQGFYPMEGLVIVSLKQSVLDEKFMKISNFNPGEIVEGKVWEIRDKGIEVEVCKGITGFIPKMHLADVTIQHPEQKFKHGDKLKCRILNVKKKYSRLLLTHKKSLVNSKYPIICSQNQVEQGQILEGFIVAVKEYGCLVAFYNDVKGLAPRQMLSTEYIQYPEKVFFVGQVVRCKVMNVDQKTNKFTLTFVLDENAAFPQKPREIPPDFKVGKAVKCKVVKKTATGLDVEVMPSNMKAFLPKMHLSDSMEMSAALWDSYQPGDIIENAMYWNKSRIALLTCKPLLLSAAEIEEEFVTEFDSLVPGMMLPGLVKTIMSYGIFVEFANGLFGLVPLQYALDKRVPDVKLFFPIGMTVSAKVVEIDKDKKRFLASLRMQDCYHGNTEVGINLTWQNLIERETLMDTLAKTDGQKGKLAQIKFGSVHKVTVTKMVKLGAICELENGIKAVVMADHLSGEPSVGDKLDCVVLYVDLEQNCVEVSLDEKLVSLVKKRINKKVVQAKVGEELKSKVEVIKEDFIVVRLSSHAKGQLAFLPAKRHWNDVLERHQYTIGQPNVVVVKRVEGDMIIASLKVHEERPLEDEDKMSHIVSHSLKIGDICDAVIRKIYKDQIYINIGQTHGRVCVTEMLDHVEDGSNPTLNMVKDQEIKVRVIGFRDNRTKRYLPISHPNVSRAMPECSMKPSIMSLEELPENYARSGNSYKIGDKVVTYVDNYSYRYLCSQVAPMVKGRVHQLSLSSDFKVLGNPGEYFKTGQCYNATVTGIVNDKLVDLSFLENPFEELSVGSETKGIITCIKKEIGLVLQLADGVRGTLDITDLSDWYVNQPTSSFKHGSLISAKVIKLEKLSKQAVLSLRKEKEPVDRRIEHVTDLSRGQIVRGYISHVSAKGVTIRLGVDVKFLLPSDRIVQGKVSSWMLKKKFKVGDVICVKFLGFDKDNQVELSVLGNSDHLDILAKPQSDSPGLSEGSKKQRKRSVSNSSADSGVQTKKIKLKNIETANEIDESIELEISGLELMESEALSEKDSTVSSVTSTNSSVTSDSAVKLEDIEERAFKDWQNLEISVPVIGKGDEDIGERSVTKTSEKIPEKEMSDSSDDESVLWSDEEETEPKILNEGLENINDVSRKSLNVTIIQKGEDRHVQADVEDAVDYAKDQFDELEFENSSTKKRKGKSNNADSVTEYSLEASSEKKKKDQKRTCSASEEDSPNKKQKADTSKVTKVEIKVVPKSEREATKKPVLEVDEGFSWTTDFKLPALKKGEISSDDSDDETQKTRVKKSKAQLLQERKEEENRLYQAEMQRLAGEGEPETVDDYDRLVLQSPDSSLVWLRYMAFHLATSEIDKARAVAERALKTISFREEQERLNVWMAYLNLENLYGTEESIKKVLTRAVQQNDQVTVYLQMVNIYVKSGKTEDAEQLFNTLVKKQSENKEVWIKYGEFYFQQGRVESARKLLQRCLKVLDKKLQVDTIAKFAQMEFKYGEAERGKTLFENILGSYTKRTDLWSVYLDMVTKVGDFEAVRAIYTRLLKKNMSAKKMKFFFKKYLQFEEKHGTPSQVEQVKKNALKYVQSKGFVDE